MLFPCILAFALSLNGSWDFRFEEGKALEDAPDDKARLFSLEFTAMTADGKSQKKLVLPEGFNHSLKHKKAQSRQVCYFRKDELGAGDVTFTVTPMNSFGARGKSLATTFKA